MKTSVKRRRPLRRFERLEARMLLAGDVSHAAFSNWHNESNPSDVNGDGMVTSLDALMAINVVTRFDMESIHEIQAAIFSGDATSHELYGGYHPDVDASGSVTAIDALRIVNRLARISSSPDVVPISVIPDFQGSPLRIVYSVADGRAKDVDVGDLNVTISWSGEEVIATDQLGSVIVIARPKTGILEVDSSIDDGQATVTRFPENGSRVTERYLCVPGTIWLEEEGRFVIIQPDDVRRPIEGFAEVLGAIVEQTTVDREGSEISRHYEEAAVRNLLSITARLVSGESVTVNVENAKLNPTTLITGSSEWGTPLLRELETFEADLLYLLRRGYQTTDEVTPSDIRLALEAQSVE